MSKNLITILGILVAILPFVSIPGSIRDPLYIIFGITIAMVGYQDRHNRRKGLVGTVVRKGRKVVIPLVAGVTGSAITPDVLKEVDNQEGKVEPNNSNEKEETNANQ